MSFFLKGKPRKAIKRKFDPKSKKGAKKPSRHNVPDADEEDNESIESDLEFQDVPDRSESEGEYETAQEKKVRLAKKYLEEIKKEEQERNENKDLDDAAVLKRLKDDYLEQQGRLHKNVAAQCVLPAPGEVSSLRCKENRLSVTCLCVSSDGRFLFSGSKCSAIVKWSLPDKKKLRTICFKKNTDTGKQKFQCHKSPVAAVAVSSDGKFLASCEEANDIQIWSADTLEHIHTFKGHRDHVTDIVFRKDSHQLFSASKDRSVKVWSLDEMAYSETLFGHQAPITAIDALSRERAVTTGGRDCSLRVWKIAEESQLIFNGHSGSIDGVKLINEENFVSCGDDGSVCVWGSTKKKALCTAKAAHGRWEAAGGQEGEVRWISSVAALLNTDLVASGSSDGMVRLWRLTPGCRAMEQVLEVPVPGFVNSLVFAPDGRTLIAGVGQEHRLARWWKIDNAKNAIFIIPIRKL